MLSRKILGSRHLHLWQRSRDLHAGLGDPVFSYRESGTLWHPLPWTDSMRVEKFNPG